MNHDKTLTFLAKALARIADVLPRTDLVAILYPTDRMKRAVAELYAYIIRLLLRVKSWYEEGKLQHAWHSFSQPVELRFADLFEAIESCSRNVDDLALAASRAEQRDMHLQIQDMAKLQRDHNAVVLEMRQMLVSMCSAPST